MTTFLLLAGSHAQLNQEFSPDQPAATSVRYNLEKPEILTLPAYLNEISGISYAAEGNAVWAIQDEQGTLYKIPLEKNAAVEQWPFGGKGDYEEIVMADGFYYGLLSSGSVVFFPATFPIANVREKKLAIEGRNEFEVLFKDPAANRLLMMCKSCKTANKNEVPVYAFNISTKTFDNKPVAALQVKEIEAVLREKTGGFRPSAANVHPQTGDIYIISSINKLLVITDPFLKVKEVHKLNPELYKQPEGICFTPAGNLLISNEAAGRGSANILLFQQQK